MNNNLHLDVVTEETHQLLIKIQTSQYFDQFYLAGGTSLSLQLGHRKSVDLDFFTDQDFDPRILNYFPEPYKTMASFPNSIDIFSCNTKVFFFYFGFPRLKELLVIDKVRLLDPIDIGLNKLLAVQSRSTKKDIVDLYFIDKEIIKLEELFKLYESQYPKDSFNVYDSLTKLVDDEELDSHPVPEMLVDFDWDKAYEVVCNKISDHITNLIMV